MMANPNDHATPNDSPTDSQGEIANPRALLDQHAKTIIEKLIERAVAGDPAALRLCVERILPRAKPDNTINFALPDGDISSGDNMLQITNNLTQAVSVGKMTVEEAQKFTEFLKHQRWQLDEAETQKRDEEWDKKRG